MPLASCNICNRRFHGKHAERVVKYHMTRMHKNHNNTIHAAQPQSVDPFEIVNIIWNGLPLHKRYSLLATFFIEQSQDSNPGGQHDHDTVDGEVISEHRAG